MKDAEFIELLNLYLDHEISAVDATRLEAEVQRSPEKRRIYQQYCRMQKACKMVAVDFESESAAAPGDLAKKVVAFEPLAEPRKSLRAIYVLGAVAAAACVVLIFNSRVGKGEGAVANKGQILAHSAAELPSHTSSVGLAGASTRTSPVSGGIMQRPMLVSDPLLLADQSHAGFEFSSAAPQGNDQLAWVRTLQLAPLQPRLLVDDLKFDARPSSLRPEAHVLGGNHAPTEGATEMTAFRFVR